MILGLIIFPLMALLGALGLVSLRRTEPGRYFLPAVRTVALVTVAVIYVAAIWSHT